MSKDIIKKGKDETASAAPSLDRFNETIPAEANAVGKFLQQRVLRAKRDGTGGGARICIRHTVGGKIGDRVDEAKLAEPEALTEETVGQLAIEICKCAANDAEQRGRGPQRYTLQWFTFEDPLDNPFVLSFEVKTGRQINSDPNGYVDSYPATEQGLSSLLIRRLDRIDDKFLEYITAMVAPLTAMKGMLETSISDNATLRNEIRANAKAIDDAKADAWRRDEQSKENAARRDMFKELTSGAKLIAPAIAKRVGLLDKTQPIPADSAHIVALVQSLANRDGLGKILTSDLLTDEEKFHICSQVEAHIKSVDLEPGPPASMAGGNGKSNGSNGKSAAASEPPAVPPAAVLAREIEVAEAQAQAWQVKLQQLKERQPVVETTPEMPKE
jgi:hypothetical protein